MASMAMTFTLDLSSVSFKQLQGFVKALESVGAPGQTALRLEGDQLIAELHSPQTTSSPVVPLPFEGKDMGDVAYKAFLEFFKNQRP